VTLDNLERDFEIRLFVYSHFAETAHPPSLAETTSNLGISQPQVRESLHSLAQAHQIALVPGTTTIWMAHPYSGVPTEHTAVIDGKEFWGN
jgi:hypothetical protein